MYADYDQHYDSNHIREHLKELCSAARKTGNEVINDVESAEEDRAENTHIGLPYGKDNERDSEPAAISEAVIRPNAHRIIHNIVQTAETRYNTSEAGSGILIKLNIYACGICSCGVLTDRAQIESAAGMLEEQCGEQCDDYREISEKAV